MRCARASAWGGSTSSGACLAHGGRIAMPLAIFRLLYPANAVAKPGKHVPLADRRASHANRVVRN
ncbi:MAG: hypothetical protein ACK56F_12205, partial [bacterium]